MDEKVFETLRAIKSDMSEAQKKREEEEKKKRKAKEEEESFENMMKAEGTKRIEN